MQEQERKTKLLKGMLLTFATLTYFNEFLQNLQKSCPPPPISSLFSLFLSSSITL